MKKTKNFLAVDFGASNGKATVGRFDGKKLIFLEMHRFENRPVYASQTLYWDILRLYHELKNSIIKTNRVCRRIESMGVDTWGCDFGLLDKKNRLISNPVHYRDKRTEGYAERVRQIIPDSELYNKTQAQIIEMNTIYQLYSMVLNKSAALDGADRLLFMADLFHFFLTGETVCEFSNATLSQLYDQKNKKWEKTIIDKLGIPENIFIETTEPGKVIGSLSRDLCGELECKPVKVSLPCYDTTSEITAIPVSEENSTKNWCYMNCGTWGMTGIITERPVVSDDARITGFGNEGGFGGMYHFLKNISALWIIQQCRKKWKEEGRENTGWDDIMASAVASPDGDIFIDVDDKVFEREIFDMPECIRKYCKKTGQKIPGDNGSISKLFYESLALKYSYNLKKLEKITGRRNEIIHMVGGGSRDSLICQYVSNSTGLVLLAGPAETTTAGNILVQMHACGEIKNINEGRRLLIESAGMKTYEPENENLWAEKFTKFKNFLYSRVPNENYF